MPLETAYRKYRHGGFATPSGRIEIFSFGLLGYHVHVRLQDHALVVFNRLLIRVKVRGVHKELDNRAVAVWVRAGVEGRGSGIPIGFVCWPQASGRSHIANEALRARWRLKIKKTQEFP